MFCNLGGLPDEAGQEEARWHPQARTSSISRQASHVSHMSASQLDRHSESGFLEQLMPYESGLQVSPALNAGLGCLLKFQLHLRD